eukprot:scaffold50171_cov109-Phaeocystis_antarctica.AAC.2
MLIFTDAAFEGGPGSLGEPLVWLAVWERRAGHAGRLWCVLWSRVAQLTSRQCLGKENFNTWSRGTTGRPPWRACALRQTPLVSPRLEAVLEEHAVFAADCPQGYSDTLAKAASGFALDRGRGRLWAPLGSEIVFFIRQNQLQTATRL